MQEKLWEKITQNLYHGDNYRRMQEVYEYIRKKVPSGKNMFVLDIGCGDGSLLKNITGNNLFGVDIVASQIELAKREGINAVFCNTDTDKLPYADKYFDIIISSEVIEHVLIPDNIFIEANRVLKDNGIFVVTTPNLASFGKRIFLLLGMNPYIEISPLEKEAVGHIRYFIFSTFKEISERHGFVIQEFTSDIINFDGSGRFASRSLARLFPTFGRTLMFTLIKKGSPSKSV